jgi:alanyl-tRNA synthetase
MCYLELNKRQLNWRQCMPTTRLYYTEPWLRRFDAHVVDAIDEGSRQRVSLDRTAFYPTSGGQPFDTGQLSGLAVADVTDEDDGRIVHVIEGSLSIGMSVTGEIDWPRRFDHMQQHTGQHILSAAFERVHGVRTESFRLGAEVSTIDLAREVTPREIAAAEDVANAVVFEGRPVSIRFVSETEALRLPLRKEPHRTGPLRLIEIADYDLSACGGTHVSRTGDVGLIAVRAAERFRGGTRLEFVCGGRALASYRSWREAAGSAARIVSSTPAELPQAIERLQQEARDARREAKGLAEKAARLEAGTLSQRASDVLGVAVLVEAIDGYDAAALKLLAGSFVKETGRAIVLFTTNTPVQAIAMRSPDVAAVDCAVMIAALTGRFGGRGGGKPEAAQAGGFQAPSDALIDAARSAISEALRKLFNA